MLFYCSLCTRKIYIINIFICIYIFIHKYLYSNIYIYKYKHIQPLVLSCYFLRCQLYTTPYITRWWNRPAAKRQKHSEQSGAFHWLTAETATQTAESVLHSDSREARKQRGERCMLFPAGDSRGIERLQQHRIMETIGTEKNEGKTPLACTHTHTSDKNSSLRQTR